MIQQVHHLNCISTCPLGGKLMDDRTPSLITRGHLSCHCLLLETASQLILVDTGLGRLDVQIPEARLSRFFLNLLSPDFRDDMTAYQQVRSLGYNPRDVRNIILTHLDFDHAGGLDDFSDAQVHLLKEERDYAVLQKTWLDRQRFRPMQWSGRQNWKMYSPQAGEKWFDFEQVRDLDGVPPEVLMIPLGGHTLGHSGIAIRYRDHWLLQAGDAYFFHEEMNPQAPWCTPGLKFYQTLMEKDRQARLHNQKRLRNLNSLRADEVTIFCAHDVLEFERLSGRSAGVPAEKVTRPGVYRRVV